MDLTSLEELPYGLILLGSAIVALVAAFAAWVHTSKPEDEDTQFHITISDADGNVVVDETFEGGTASQAELDDIVAMIEAGCPAHVAAASILAERGG